MKLLLLDPWSHTNATTFKPVLSILSTHCLVSDLKIVALIGPELRKYPTGYFHLEASPLTINAMA